MGRPLLCGPGFVNIDPMSYDDPATGKRLLYWGSGFGPIKVQELAPDRMSFAAGSAPVDLIQVVKTEDPADYRRLIEGAWVLKRGPWYYLFYSGDNCCGPKAHYAALVARSRSATGPFETLGAEKGRAQHRGRLDPRWIAPGHNSIAEDGAGNHWILYHAVDARGPAASRATTSTPAA
jgi:arabinan endo-1,5-alpha-L-arabinosidase